MKKRTPNDGFPLNPLRRQWQAYYLRMLAEGCRPGHAINLADIYGASMRGG